MSGDYSRKRFNPDKHYQGVLRQQGRVDLDADWNEYIDLQDRRWRAETIDAIGRCGVPFQTPDGFKIQTSAGQLTVGPGRIYVDGYLAENHGAEPQFNPTLEEDYGLAPFPVAEFPEARSLVYLDVWRREVTHLQDPELIEPAINVDSTARYQTAWQVRVLPLDSNATITCQTPLVDLPGWLEQHAPSTARLTTTTVAVAAESDPCLVPPTGGYRGLENHLYRVEVHRMAGTAALVKWSRENAHVATTVLKIEHAGTTTSLAVDSLGRDETLSFKDDGWVEILSDSDELAGTAGVMRKVTVDPDTNQLIVAPPLDAVIFPDEPVDADLHLRVMCWDQSGSGLTSEGLIEVTAANPSFVLEHGIQVTLDGLAGARVGDYWCFAARTAEADIERLEQAPPHGIHHHFCKLAIIESNGVIQDCRPVFPSLTELVSLFYVSGDGQEAPPGLSLPQPLQVGVANGQWPVTGATVRFTITAGTGKLQGDKTFVDVLTDTGGIASCTWTLDAINPSQQVQASLLSSTGMPLHLPVRFNASLGEQTFDTGVHITKIVLANGNILENDTEIPISNFSEGIVIQCDKDIEPSTVANRPVCRVTIDMPWPFNEMDQKVWGNAVLGYTPITLAATNNSRGPTISWAPAPATTEWLQKNLLPMLSKLERGTRVLAHLTLLGNFIWQSGKPEVWIDGDVFGRREKLDLSPTVLRLPSGDGRRGGNLEMWFWLVEPEPEPVTVTIKPATANVAVGKQENFTVTVTGTSNTGVTVNVSPKVGGGQVTTKDQKNWTYTAPQTIPRQSVIITATSKEDPTKFNTAQVTVVGKDNMSITIDPSEVTKVLVNQKLDFTVTVQGNKNTDVDVTVITEGGGTIAPSKKAPSVWEYTAPKEIPKGNSATIHATSKADPTHQPAEAKVTFLDRKQGDLIGRGPGRIIPSGGGTVSGRRSQNKRKPSSHTERPVKPDAKPKTRKPRKRKP